MSAAVGTFSASKQVGFKENETKNDEEEFRRDDKNKKFVVVDDDDEADNINGDDHREGGDDDHNDDDEHDEEDDVKLKSEKELDLGPQFSLKEQLEKDKVFFHFSAQFFFFPSGN